MILSIHMRGSADIRSAEPCFLCLGRLFILHIIGNEVLLSFGLHVALEKGLC